MEGRRTAILVGVGRNRAPWPQLPAVQEELHLLRDMLTEGLHTDFRFADVTTLEDDEVTVESLEEQLDKLAQNPAIDQLLLYFAGHGEMRRKHPYFVTYEGTEAAPGIRIDELMESICALTIPRVFVVADFCHAGALVDQLRWIEGKRGQRTQNVAVFASAQGSQLAEAAPEPARAFSKILVDAMREASADDGGIIRWGSVVLEVQQRMEACIRQRPISYADYLAMTPINRSRPAVPGPRIRLGRGPATEKRFLRRRCRVVRGGSARFRKTMKMIMAERQRPGEKGLSRGFESEYERAMLFAAIAECEGRVEAIREILEEVRFYGEQECCRRLYLGIAFEKANELDAALEEFYWVLRNAEFDREILAAAQFNSYVCLEKGDKFGAVDFERFLRGKDLSLCTGERLRWKALSMELILCKRAKKVFQYEEMVETALTEEREMCPAGYVKTAVNWALYKNGRIGDELVRRAESYMAEMSVNAKATLLYHLAAQAEGSGDAEAAERLLSLLRELAMQTKSRSVEQFLEDVPG